MVGVKWPISLLVIVFSLKFLDALATRDIIAFLAPPEVKAGRGGATATYACSAEGETGPCVDEPIFCTTQGGKFLGYCFFQGQYEGVCCTGLQKPANSMLNPTKVPKTQSVSTLAPPTSNTPAETLSPGPSTTFSTSSPAPFSSSLPPAPSTSSVLDDDAPSTATLPPVPTQNPGYDAASQPITNQNTFQPPPQFDNLTNSSSSAPRIIVFPTLTTQTNSSVTQTTHSLPDMNVTTTSQTTNVTSQFNTSTAHAFNFTSHQINMTIQVFPNLTVTTDGMNLTTQQFNMTMTAQHLPNISELAGNTSIFGNEGPSEVSTPPAFGVSHDEYEHGGCALVSYEIQSNFHNPSYPGFDTEPDVYEYTVAPHDDYCALRIEFLESHLAGKGVEGCSTDSVVIIGSVETPTVPQCGLLEGYQFTVRQEQWQPVKIVITTQSAEHLWNIIATQIHCSSIWPYQEYEWPNCGLKNPKLAHFSGYNEREEPKSVAPAKLLKSRKKTLMGLLIDPSLGPSTLLHSDVLNREADIKIVRGNQTGVNEYPWQALLMVNGKPLCGASVINDQWVVTAGHCVQLSLRHPLTSVLTIDLGDHDLRTTKETRNLMLRVAKIVPNVENEGVVNDIALIKLASRIPLGKTIRPVCLPPTKTSGSKKLGSYTGRTGITTGWGRTEDSVLSPVLREATLPIISNTQCRHQWETVGEGAGTIITRGMICAGGGDVGHCNSDPGGALIVEDQGRCILVGVTSFGILRGCAVSGVPSVFTRVSAYVNWIALNLAEAG